MSCQNPKRPPDGGHGAGNPLVRPGTRRQRDMDRAETEDFRGTPQGMRRTEAASFFASVSSVLSSAWMRSVSAASAAKLATAFTARAPRWDLLFTQQVTSPVLLRLFVPATFSLRVKMATTHGTRRCQTFGPSDDGLSASENGSASSCRRDRYRQAGKADRLLGDPGRPPYPSALPLRSPQARPW